MAQSKKLAAIKSAHAALALEEQEALKIFVAWDGTFAPEKLVPLAAARNRVVAASFAFNRAKEAAEPTTAELDSTFVAVGPHCWGKGATQEIAVRNCKKEAPRSLLKKGKHNINVFRVLGFNYVSDVDGSINYHQKGRCDRVATVQMVAR